MVNMIIYIPLSVIMTQYVYNSIMKRIKIQEFGNAKNKWKFKKTILYKCSLLLLAATDAVLLSSRCFSGLAKLQKRKMKN